VAIASAAVPDAPQPLADIRVVDLTTGIAGPYATKLLADAGADVVKVEPAGGDPLRRWSATGADLAGRDAALFRFLHHGKRSVVGSVGDPGVADLVAGADVVFEELPPEAFDARRWREADPALVVVSVTPFGRSGPYAGRPATSFTLEAESGSLASRGRPGIEPFQAGGRLPEWVAGTYAAVAALAAVIGARCTGHGEHVDLSIHEAITISGGLLMDMLSGLLGRPNWPNPPRALETPSVEPTGDGWVGFNTNTRQQFEDFCALIGRPDLGSDPQLASAGGRMQRWDEWNAIVRDYTREHTTEEIVSLAALLRIPVAPVLDGRTVLEHEHFTARGVFVDSPDGTFRHPRPPYLIDGRARAITAPAPALGEHTGAVEPRPPRDRSSAARRLPLEGVRVLDLTNWWAGPAATNVVGILGADVVKVESVQKPDGMRFASTKAPDADGWWEWGFMYVAANTNKRGITLDLTSPEGLAVARRLVAWADVVVENFSPRVVERFGLDWPAVHEINPAAVMVRMPAFGLDGPWRDHVGFAQTMEQITGMAWVTGHLDDQPRIPRGPCDPNAGMHAAFALLVALVERDRTGSGSLVECPMVEGALNAAAEQVVELSAYGRLLGRAGNRSPDAAPQGIYPCRGHVEWSQERWLALSVRTTAQWRALREVLGSPAWSLDPALDSLAARREAADRIDMAVAAWASTLDLDAALGVLVEAGVPAAPLVDTRATAAHPHLAARGFYETLVHPVVGEQQFPSVPFRFESVERWLTRPSPTLGQHNHEVLAELGYSDEEISALEARQVIGTRPIGA
jgi:crotonobetainyl-CoA:carnitine CoA-transferase CaiB-like acyl-CoA transferase